MDDVPEPPWPECLGSFDEESCRFFLHEIGGHVVPFYPFSFGMEEVYASIIRRYGFNGSPDVLSILQELLEGECNAEGLGDDGDIWRSWRHSWRHRNDDQSNPFIPRTGNCTLPAPTTTRIRLLKAQTFLQAQESTAKTRAVSNEEVKALCSPDRRSSLHRISRPHVSRTTTSTDLHSDEIPSQCPRTSQGCMMDIPYDFERESTQILRSASGDTPGPSTFMSERYDKVSLTLGGDTIDLRGERSVPSSRSESLSESGSLNECLNLPSTASRSGSAFSSHGVEPNSPWRHAQIHLQDGQTPSAGSMQLGHELVLSSRFEGDHSPSLDGSRSQSRNSYSNTGQGVVTVTASSGRISTSIPVNNNITTVNRQARLIDGTILTSCTRRARSASRTERELISRSIFDKESFPAVSILAPNNNKTIGHVHWLRRVRAIFHREVHLNTVKNQRHRSAPMPRSIQKCSSPMNMSPSQTLRGCNTSDPSRLEHDLYLGLDGAVDIIHVHGSVNLNKPLPVTPEDVQRGRTSASSPTHSQFRSTTSTMSSTTSGTSISSRSREALQQKINPTVPVAKELVSIKEDEDHHLIVGMQQVASLEPQLSPRSDRGLKFQDRTFTPPPFPSSNVSLPPSHSAPTLQFAKARKQKIGHIPLRPISRPKSTHAEEGYQYDSVLKDMGQSAASSLVLEKALSAPKTPTKRPQSPVKRLLGIGKAGNFRSSATDSTPPVLKTPKTPTSKKSSVKMWGDKLRYGFLSQDEEQLQQEQLQEQHMNNSETPPSRTLLFPISLDPPHQAKVYSEIELIVAVTANRYLVREAGLGRVSAESVTKLQDYWHSLGRSQVVDFFYDQMTQHNLIITNLKTVRLYGDAAKDPFQINSTLHAWKMMAKDFSARTFCYPDSVVRKHLHDGHRVLELLGAPLVTFLAYDTLQVKTLSRISAKQQERMARRGGSARGRSSSDDGRVFSTGSRRNLSEGSADFEYTVDDFQMDKINLAPSPTPTSTSRIKSRKSTGGEGAIMSLPFMPPNPRTRQKDRFTMDQHHDDSKDGRLSRVILEKPEDVLL